MALEMSEQPLKNGSWRQTVRYTNSNTGAITIGYFYKDSAGDYHRCDGPAIHYPEFPEDNEYWVHGQRYSEAAYKFLFKAVA